MRAIGAFRMVDQYFQAEHQMIAASIWNLTENSGNGRFLCGCGSAPCGDAARPHTLKKRLFNNFRIDA
jgi:hypothetical protein